MNLRIHHVGYITRDITTSVIDFEHLGYIREGGVFHDDIQMCKICLLKHLTNQDRIELVEPYEINVQMQRLLKKQGSSPYHICYEVDDVENVGVQFENIEGWINIFKSKPAIALENRKISYFYNPNIGFVEFVNKNK